MDAVHGPRDRLRDLLGAVLSIGRDLDLPQVLRDIVEAAMALVDAEYGALGVIGEDGKLSEFVPVGVSDGQRAAIGAPPSGHGLLGELIRHPEPLRLAELSEHHASHGFPRCHPPMRSFLGAPIRVRGKVFGNLYLTEKRGASEFGADDEAVLTTLAVAAGVAIENARLYEESCCRERWLAAGAEVTSSLLSGRPRAEVLALILARARANLSADVGIVGVPVEGSGKLRITLASGTDAQRRQGTLVSQEDGYLGAVMAGLEPLRSQDIEHDPRTAGTWGAGLGPALAVPLGSGAVARGVLLLARTEGGVVFDDEESAFVTGFARQAALAMELAERRRDAEHLALLEERDRIARDLHDIVVQRLFATGLTLQGAQRCVDDPQVAEKLRRAVSDLDATGKIIRSAIFGLRAHDAGAISSQGLRRRIAHVAEASAASLGFPPAVRVEGLVETRVPDPLAADVAAVLTEALSNVARHAGASAVDVRLRVTSDRLTLTVTDNGAGIPAGAGRSGLRNIEERARAAGGTAEVSTPPLGGTRLLWSVPLEGSSAG